MIKNYYWLWLILIVFFGSILRIVRLDKVPPHLGNDEISIAFDSYSVRTSGKDEHGNYWPLSFESHRTYKSPLYAYLNMPINMVVGNNEYGIRLLSALAGIAAIILISIMGKMLAGSEVGLIAAGLLALNPKAIMMSRIAFESNLAYVVMTCGILLMFKYLSKKNIWLAILAGVILGVSIWGYHTQWGLVPLLAVILPILSRNKLSIKKWWPMYLSLFLVSLPIFLNFVGVQLQDKNNRASSQIWLDEGVLKDYLKGNDSQLRKALVVATTPVNNYVQHFSLDSLFTSGADFFNGDNPLEVGWFFLGSLPLLIIGLFKIKIIFKENTNWLLGWWLLCPIIPAMTYGGVASVRNLSFLIPTTLIMAGGFKYLIEKYKLWSLLIGIILVINFLIFLIAYFVHFPLDSGDNFQYGYKQAWEYIKPNINKYESVVVESKFGKFGQFVGVPHLYFGYFEAFTPEEMQKRIDNNGTKIGKFTFKEIDWNKEDVKMDSIYVVSIINPRVGKYYDNLKLVKTIYKPDQEPQFLIYETENRVK
jgi:4-amino-4-deoxy-L-arabinose transferase-like glycosyltransferase